MLLYVFEFITYAFLVSSVLFAYLLIRSFFYSDKNKKTKLKLFIAIILIIGFITIFYGSFIEPRMLFANEYNININKNKSIEKIRMAVVADTHFGPFKKYNYSKKIADKLNSQNPDLIVLLGDYIYGDAENAKYLEPVLKLSKKYPIFAISGNHDYHLPAYKDPNQKDKTQVLRKLLKKYNVKLLENANQRLIINNQEFYLVGIKEIWTGQADFEKSMHGIDKTLPIITLCHNPDFIVEVQNKIDLMLSGHTHGGQITFPGIGPLTALPDELGRKYDKGLFRFENSQLFITKGAGETGPRARLFNPPEIAILNINL